MDTPKNQGCSGQDAGNPCNAGTGNKRQEEADYLGAGEFPLRFVRRYGSLVPRETHLGHNWRHSYDGRVLREGTTVRVERPSGPEYVFHQESGVWRSDGDVNGQLQQLSDGWRYISETGDQEETYGAAGRLLSIQNRAGLRQTLAYSDAGTAPDIAPAPGLLIEIADPFGRKLKLAYDAAKRLRTLTDPAGGVYRYEYDAQDRLSRVSQPDATPGDSVDDPARLYHYEDPRFPNALTGLSDENGARFASWTYDAEGRAVSSEHSGGVERGTLAYQTDGSTAVTDALGKTRRYVFDNILGVVRPTRVEESCPGCVPRTRTLGYDAQGNRTSERDFNGNVSCYAYDLARNLETVRLEGIAPGGTCPADLSAYTPAPGSSERKIVTTWHASFRLPIRLDEAGRRTEFVYDALGNLLSKTLTDTSTGQSRVWTYTYNPLGQMLTEDGPRTDASDVTAYAYDSQGNLSTVTDPLGQVSRLTGYDAHGRPVSLVDPNGLTTTLEYDAKGRLIRLDAGGEITQYAYDAAGQLSRITRPDGGLGHLPLRRRPPPHPNPG